MELKSILWSTVFFVQNCSYEFFLWLTFVEGALIAIYFLIKLQNDRWMFSVAMVVSPALVSCELYSIHLSKDQQMAFSGVIVFMCSTYLILHFNMMKVLRDYDRRVPIDKNIWKLDFITMFFVTAHWSIEYSCNVVSALHGLSSYLWLVYVAGISYVYNTKMIFSLIPLGIFYLLQGFEMLPSDTDNHRIGYDGLLIMVLWDIYFIILPAALNSNHHRKSFKEKSESFIPENEQCDNIADICLTRECEEVTCSELEDNYPTITIADDLQTRDIIYNYSEHFFQISGEGIGAWTMIERKRTEDILEFNPDSVSRRQQTIGSLLGLIMPSASITDSDGSDGTYSA